MAMTICFNEKFYPARFTENTDAGLLRFGLLTTPMPQSCQWILLLNRVDLGEIAAWGYPTTYRHRNRFHDYVVSPWRHGVKPDLVLIDGRFRVASFLHSLLTAEPGTRLIFDDYNNRPHYHLVEEFCPVKEREGRQALFLVPDQLERPAIVAEEERFLYVRD